MTDQPPAGQADRERALQVARLRALLERIVRPVSARDRDLHATWSEAVAVLDTDPDAGAQELWAAANEMARVLDEEIMPRYVEFYEEAGLGLAIGSVAVEESARVLARWRRAAGLGER